MKKDEQARKRTAKNGKKKQSNLRQCQHCKKEGGGAGIGAGASKYPTPADFPSKISEQENKRLEQEEVKRNKESSNANFYLRANAKLGELFRRAKSGDVDAARMLLGCLTHNVGEFEKFCSSKIRIAKRIVVVGESWPLLHTDLKASDGALTIPSNHVLRKLGVVRGGRRYNLATKGTAVAAKLYYQMEWYRHTARQQLWDKLSENVKAGTATVSGMSEKHLEKIIDRIRRLKPLSPSNYRVWWKAAEPLFIWQWGEEFQDHPVFENWNAGAYTKRKLERRAQESGRKQSARSAKRHDVRRAVEQGFMSLANSLRERVLD